MFLYWSQIYCSEALYWPNFILLLLLHHEIVKCTFHSNSFLFLFLTDSVLVQSSRKPLASDPQRRNTDQNQTGLGVVAFNDLQSVAREEGEGMETTETEKSSPALIPLPSLEQLLTAPDPKQGVFEATGAFITEFEFN